MFTKRNVDESFAVFLNNEPDIRLILGQTRFHLISSLDILLDEAFVERIDKGVF